MSIEDRRGSDDVERAHGEVRRYGEHIVEWDPRGLIVIRVVGDLSPEDVKTMFAATGELAHVLPAYWAIIDLSRTGDMPPATRAAVKDGAVLIKNRAAALFGARFSLRVIATLVIKAVILLRKDWTAEWQFFDTEADARAWIEAQIQALR